MGNRLHQIEENKSNEKQSRIYPRIARESEESSSEYSESDESEDSQLNWWQKLIYRDQQHLQQNAPSNQNKSNFANHQHLIRHEEGQMVYRPEQIGTRAEAEDQVGFFEDLGTGKLVFTEDMQKQAEHIKLDWKAVSQLENSSSDYLRTTHKNYGYSLINNLKLLNISPQRQMYYAKYKQKIIQTQNSSLIVAQRIEIKDSELANHITRSQMFTQGQFNSIIDSQNITQAKQLNELIYKWRLFVSKMALWQQEQSLPIVGVYEAAHSRFNMSFESKTVIYQELILYRMSDIRNLSHLQGIYVLEQSLVGFKMLYDIFGHFLIEETMIGFNSHGQLKVWISPCFWSNLCYSSRKSHHLQTNTTQNRLYQGQKRYQEEDMVGRIWMTVQKYSLFHQSIVMESAGFIRCNFHQALQIIIRHKASIINRRDGSLGLVEFVHRLQFESQLKTDYRASDIQNRSFQNINGPLMEKVNYSQHPKLQKPLPMKPAESVISTSPNLQSHIRILAANTQAKSGQKCLKRRKQIFTGQYSHTMSNNMDQTHSMIKSEYVLNSKHRAADSQFGDRLSPSSNVRFINIKSIK